MHEFPDEGGEMRKPPDRISLHGRFGFLEPLSPMRHSAGLWEALKDSDEVFAFLPYGNWGNEKAFFEWLEGRAASTDPLCYAVCTPKGQAVGLVSLMAIRPEHRAIEIGHVVFAPMLQRTSLATETIYLLAQYVFETLNYRRLEWKCDNANAASKAAARRFGFMFEGIFHKHMIVKGRDRDTAWFAMLDDTWPLCRSAWEAWLKPENFDAQGRQRLRLEDIRVDLQASSGNHAASSPKDAG